MIGRDELAVRDADGDRRHHRQREQADESGGRPAKCRRAGQAERQHTRAGEGDRRQHRYPRRSEHRENSRPLTRLPTPIAPYSTPMRPSSDASPSTSTAYGTSSPSTAPKAKELPKPTPSSVAIVRSPRMKSMAAPIRDRRRPARGGRPRPVAERRADRRLHGGGDEEAGGVDRHGGGRPDDRHHDPGEHGTDDLCSAARLPNIPLAAGSRLGPTSAGTAPNTAASENTNTDAESRATAYTWPTVNTPRTWATGIVRPARLRPRCPR